MTNEIRTLFCLENTILRKQAGWNRTCTVLRRYLLNALQMLISVHFKYFDSLPEILNNIVTFYYGKEAGSSEK